MSDQQNTNGESRLSDDELSQRWIQESEQYLAALKEYIQRADEVGWEDFEEKEPEDGRKQLAQAVIDAIRRANQAGDTDGLNKQYPYAHGPLIPLLKTNGQSIPMAYFIDNDRIVARVGANYDPGQVVVIHDKQVEPLPANVLTIGRSPNREFFAVARADGVTIHRGWEGPVVAKLAWPTGQEGIPKGFKVEQLQSAPTITRLLPLDTGDKALLASPEGVFVLTQDRAIRLLPTKPEFKEHFEWLQTEYPNDPLSYDLSMEHVAISPDGKLIATGHQTSLHYVFGAETFEIVAEVGHLSEYPHLAVFSADGSLIAFNSCHFYNGLTIGVPTAISPGLKTEPYELDDRLIQLEEGSRVYAAVARNDEFITGDANGYLRAFDTNGNARWRHFIGSTVESIDISPNGKRLVVTTYAGFLSILELDTDSHDPFAIGDSNHREQRRWLFWKHEEKPLIW